MTTALLIGSMEEGTCWPPCRRALEAKGCNTVACDDAVVFEPFRRSLAWRAFSKLTSWPMVRRYSRQLREFLGTYRGPTPDLVLVCKGQYLTPDRVREVKDRTGAVLFNWQTDDYFSPTLSSQHAIDSIPLYDCIFVHARANAEGLRRAGARRVEYLPLGADPGLYHPIDEAARPVYQTDVLYMGIRRRDREETLSRLVADGCSYRLQVRGGHWTRVSRRSPLYPHVVGEMVPWKEYPHVLRCAKVSIALLTRFDTGVRVAPLRIFEIAATGGFLLAERGNGEIAEFFDEGKEMACFADVEEMRDKIEYFLGHDEERRAIALAGQRRAVAEDYFYTSRMQRMLDVYREIRRGIV